MAMQGAKVSIVMTYFDRFDQLMNTLRSFQLHGYENYEVIIVDDASLEKPLENSFFKDFGIDIKLLKVRPKDKTYTNPSVPYNLGFKKATGDIVIIQNSECLHVYNILKHARGNLTRSNYFSYGCYSFDKKTTNQFYNQKWNIKDLQAFVKYANQVSVGLDGDMGWYNHSKFRPVAYHFTAAIHRDNLHKLGGFDERYASGIGFDDDDLVLRVTRLGLKVQIIDHLPVVHQWHYSQKKSADFAELYGRNMALYRLVSKKESGEEPSQLSLRYLYFVVLMTCKKLFKFRARKTQVLDSQSKNST